MAVQPATPGGGASPVRRLPNSDGFGEGSPNGDSEAEGAADADDTEEMDEKAWLEAAKSGELKAMKAGLALDPSLLAASSPGIGHTALHWCALRACVRVRACCDE